MRGFLAGRLAMLAIGALLASTGDALADAEVPGLAQSPEGFGIGVIMGEPTGISAIWRRSDRHAVDLALAWSVPQERIHLHADYLFNLARFQDQEAPGVDLLLYAGAGPRIRLGDGSSGTLLGVRIPVGLAVLPEKVPLDVFLELVPVMALYPETRMDLDAGLGLRLFFGG